MKKTIIISIIILASTPLFAQKNTTPLDSNMTNSIKILFNPFIIGKAGTNDFEYITLEYEKDFNSSFALASSFTYKPKKYFGYYNTYFLSYQDYIKISTGNLFDFLITAKKHFFKFDNNEFYFGLGLGGGISNNTMKTYEKMICFVPRAGIFYGYQYRLKRYCFDFRFLNFQYIKVINKNFAHTSGIFQYNPYLGIGYSF